MVFAMIHPPSSASRAAITIFAAVRFADPAEGGLRREGRDHLGKRSVALIPEPGTGGAGGDGVDTDAATALSSLAR